MCFSGESGEESCSVAVVFSDPFGCQSWCLQGWVVSIQRAAQMEERDGTTLLAGGDL